MYSFLSLQYLGLKGEDKNYIMTDLSTMMSNGPQASWHLFNLFVFGKNVLVSLCVICLPLSLPHSPKFSSFH